jgi:hypothetical protein
VILYLAAPTSASSLRTFSEEEKAVPVNIVE